LRTGSSVEWPNFRAIWSEVNSAPAKRETLAKAILAHAEAGSLVSIPASQIDRIGLRPASLACLEQALRALGARAELRLVDCYTLGAGAPSRVDRARRRHERDYCRGLDRGQR
jgi:ribonuclease HII